MTIAKGFLHAIRVVDFLHNLKIGGGKRSVFKGIVRSLVVRHVSVKNSVPVYSIRGF